MLVQLELERVVRQRVQPFKGPPQLFHERGNDFGLVLFEKIVYVFSCYFTVGVEIDHAIQLTQLNVLFILGKFWRQVLTL